MASSFSHPVRVGRVSRVGRLAIRTVAILPAAILIVTGACTAPLQTPGQIGDCTDDGGSACTYSSPSGGVVLPVDGGSLDDSGEIISESLDGGSCGQVDILLAADCSACVEQNCCMSDAICSKDTDGCFVEIECAALGTACPVLTSLPAASQTNYDDLLQCIDLYCPSQCLTVANRDN